MPERVVVIQDSRFNTTIEAPPPGQEDGKLGKVKKLHELTPYGMMLSGLGSCTAIVLNTFANNHAIALEKVEIRLGYERDYQKDCRDCETSGPYTEKIIKEIALFGPLDQATRQKLFRVARYCPIYKILTGGIAIESRLAE